MRACGVNEKEITIIAGYRNDVLKSRFQGTEINFIVNSEFETTNMVCSLMCALLQKPVHTLRMPHNPINAMCFMTDFFYCTVFCPGNSPDIFTQ